MTNFIDDKPGGLKSIAGIDRDFLLKADALQAKENARLSALPKCPTCGKPMDGGYCRPCRDLAMAADTEKRLEIIRLGGRKAYEQFTIQRFTNKAAIESCKVYPGISLFLWGPAGCGKTHLATALVRNHGGQVIKPQDIYRESRGHKSGEEEKAVIMRYVNMPYFVLDDLGVDKKTEFSFSILYEIIDGRDMALMPGLIITSNLSLNALADRLDDDRITSRIAGMCKIVELTGKDHRIL
jgi:DNA replication protein DnaC